MSIIYNSLNETVNNFGGSATRIGIPLNNIQNRLNLSNVVNLAYYEHPNGSTVTENSSVQKASQPHVFAYNHDRPLIKGYTRLINLTIIATDLGTPGRKDPSASVSIHPRTKNFNRLDTSAIRNKNFNTIAGKFDAGYPGVNIDNFGTDRAASISRNNPGVFVFATSQSPVVKNYEAKR